MTPSYEADEDERDAVVRKLRDLLREGGPTGPQAVQFLLDGELVDDDVFSVCIERGGDAVYLPVGNLFVEEPRPLGPKHAAARK